MNKHTENLTNLEYCYEKCELGKAKGKEFIEENNSAFDAAIDFHIFVEECKKTCDKCIEA